MVLNKQKTKAMVFNFTNKFQFSTRISMDNATVEIIRETKLLGVKINNKLTWDENTKFIVKKANARLRLLHKLVQFGVPQEDLVTIFILFIRSCLEQSCQVWHSSLTLENLTDLERVQKNSLKIILQNEYLAYGQALEHVGLESLYDRRENLCLNFARKCTTSSNLHIQSMFPYKYNDLHTTTQTRNSERFRVQMAHKDRFKKSALPYMQRLLNTNSE